jgi:hypothetical protein
MQVLFNKFHRRINLMVVLVTILGSRNTKKYSKFWNLTSLRYLPYKFRLRRVKTWVLLSKLHPRTYLMALLLTKSGSRNKNFEMYILKGYLPYKFRLRKVEEAWFFFRTNLKHSLLPICGKFTRALLAHQIFYFPQIWNI